MDPISTLAELLRENGDRISNNSCKFTLTTDLLNHLNSSFNLIIERRDALTSSFHVLANTYETNEKNRDLHFLYDFVQLAKSLKLTKNQDENPESEFTNISKFKELCFLELQKVNVNTVFGIAALRIKLQYLTCERSILKLTDILESCGADKCNGEVWCELKEASFKHNNLKYVDNCLKYVPWLNTLDLSNNSLENVDSLLCLVNLKYLNVSFNQLTKVPSFTGQICRRLQVLVLHNNYIDNIHNVHKLTNLLQLNLMDNCLIEYDSLIPLSYLAALQFLNLLGNPISYHPQHRIRSVRYLHNNTASVQFILDKIRLNKTEQQCINSLHPKIYNIETSSGSNSTETGDINDRSVKVRQAVIADDTLEIEFFNPVSVLYTSYSENIDGKEQMATLHKDYIKNLYDKTGVNTKDISKSVQNNIHIETHQQPLASTPLGESILSTIDTIIKDDLNITENTTEAYQTASEIITNNETEDDVSNQVYENATEDEKEEDKEISDDEELECGESNIFMATIKGALDDIIVIITETHVTEKDPMTMKSLGRFTLDSLNTCEMITENDIQYVHLEFDTLRINSSRYYAFEMEEEQDRFHDRLKHIIDTRPPKEISNLFTCMKCSTQFGVEDQKTIHKEETVCPVCGSNLVFEENSS